MFSPSLTAAGPAIGILIIAIGVVLLVAAVLLLRYLGREDR
ncbi:hypothetical protein [Glaciihabitans sp. INWT7]|nr:hypothetical protein [Glaciihabitans sp. INWT7]